MKPTTIDDSTAMNCRQIRLLLLVLLAGGLCLACGKSETKQSTDTATLDAGDTATPDGGALPSFPPRTTDCRPVDHVWDPATEPMLLPCEPTTEPCDNVDNDADGFLDPHCPTISCLSDADCTFGGLLPDADCNQHPSISSATGEELPANVCNQIDGVPGTADLEKCWGKLCPPTLKCVEGDCVPPGSGLPGTVCTSGADCPLNAGCIPKVVEEQGNTEATDGTCKWYCHEFSCPEGMLCEHSQDILPDTGELFETWVCDVKVCVPDCTDKDCGDDGCGGECPDVCPDVCDPETNQCTSSGDCINSADLALAQTVDFVQQAFQCVQQGNSDNEQITQCLITATAVSEKCASCHAALMACVFSICDTECETGPTPDCEECTTAQCGPPFQECSGLNIAETPL